MLFCLDCLIYINISYLFFHFIYILIFMLIYSFIIIITLFCSKMVQNFIILLFILKHRC